MINRKSILYQIVTDRFDNDDGTLERVRQEPDYQSRLRGRVGGTFRGIERRIEYLADLGVTHVMISPVEECPPECYHGYHVTKPGEINPRFGTPEDLSRLVERLSEVGISTVLDYVPLIIFSESDLFREKIQTPAGREWFFFRENLNHPLYGEDAQRLSARQCCGEGPYFYFFEPRLPYFNLANPEAVNWNLDRLTNLMRKYRFSDVRLDIGFYMPERIVKQFRDTIKAQVGEDVSVVIENWPWPIEEFNGGDFYGFCDGEFDIKGTILLNNYGNEPKLITKLRDHFYRTKGKSDCGFSFITGIDNHDLPRFQGDAQMQKLAATMQFTLPNFTPMMLYGNESAMRNEGDDDKAYARGVMDFSNTPLLDFYKRLIAFRKANNFCGARMINYHYHDTNQGANFENQLVTYTLVFPDGKKYHVVANREAREKPADLGLLFGDGEFIPVDSITGKELPKTDDNRFVIGSQEAYIFDNKRNKAA